MLRLPASQRKLQASGRLVITQPRPSTPSSTDNFLLPAARSPKACDKGQLGMRRRKCAGKATKAAGSPTASLFLCVHRQELEALALQGSEWLKRTGQAERSAEPRLGIQSFGPGLMNPLQASSGWLGLRGFFCPVRLDALAPCFGGT